MGLAASQARLLTITSRLSSNELRQQNIANAKMRLSNDSDKISQEYSNALNNQTLKFNGAPLNYDDLLAAGYSVKKTSDITAGTSVVPGSSVSKGEGASSGNKTIITKDESLKPSMTLEEKKALEPQVPTVTRPYPRSNGNMNKVSIDDIVASFKEQHASLAMFNKGKLKLDEDKLKANYNSNANANSNANRWDLASDSLGRPAEFGFESPSFSRRGSEDEDTMKPEAVGTTVPYSSSEIDIVAIKSTLNTLIQNLRNRIAETGNGIDTACDVLTNSVSSDLAQSGLLVGGPFLVNYDSYIGKYDNTIMQANASVVSNNQYIDNYEKALADYNAAWAEYNSSHAQWQTEYNDLVTAWDKYNNSSVTVDVPDDNPAPSPSPSGSEDLPSQLRSNPDYLIQGLLSGYLALFDNEGKMVSLSSNNQITTEYDTTDDAAAEAKYNSAMAKINRKEKLLDTQAANLNTEYSALSTELESINSIIQNHASKDFELFS